MNKDYLADVYRDFFESPLIDVEKVSEEENSSFDWSLIESLLIDEEGKELLKKIFDYMRRYHDKEEERYLDFHFVLNSDNKETIQRFEKIVEEAAYSYQYIDRGIGVVSFYDIDTVEKAKEVMKKNLIIIKDMKGLSLRDEAYKKVFFHDLEENIHHKIIIIEGIKEEIDYFFQFDNMLRNRAFPFLFMGKDPDIQDIYQEILEITHCNKEDSFAVEILDYISKTYPKREMDYPSYRDTLCREILFHHRVPIIREEKTLEEIFAELNELVGLGKVKKTLYELVDYMKLREKTTDLNLKNINLHMVFLGNPGTGKTTVARILVDILYELKYIKQNKLIEVSSKDLVAEYVGQTAPRTMEVVERAMGGILFIDEAYALANKDGKNTYNAEAIATLIKAMEDYRDDLVVIFAGYTKEMQDFLDSNSGIVSRIGYTLEFDDYTEDELVKIFDGMMKKAGFTVREDAYDKLREIIQENIHTKNFGNARFIRNVYEKTIIKHASNTKDKKRKTILSTITKEDISSDNIGG